MRLHRRQRNAERGELGVRQLDPDLLVLQADQFDLADVGMRCSSSSTRSA
jgi:hypothetical protein